MRYKIKDIPHEGLVVSQAIERSQLAEALDGTGVDLDRTSGAVELQLSKSDRVVYVRGSVKATVALPCALCIGPASVTIDAPVKMVFSPEDEDEDEDEEAAAENPLDDSDFGTYDGELLDLDAMVRELLILSVPMSPRCKEGCRGLCIVCGENRNDRECGHQQPELVAATPLGAQLGKLKLDTEN